MAEKASEIRFKVSGTQEVVAGFEKVKNTATSAQRELAQTMKVLRQQIAGPEEEPTSKRIAEVIKTANEKFKEIKEHKEELATFTPAEIARRDSERLARVLAKSREGLAILGQMEQKAVQESEIGRSRQLTEKARKDEIDSAMKGVSARAKEKDEKVKSWESEVNALSASMMREAQVAEEAEEVRAKAAEKLNKQRVGSFTKSETDKLKASDSLDKQKVAAFTKSEMDKTKAEESEAAGRQKAADALDKKRVAAYTKSKMDEVKADEKATAGQLKARESLDRQRSAALIKAEKESLGGALSGFGGKMVLGMAAGRAVGDILGDKHGGQEVGSIISGFMFGGPLVGGAIAGMELLSSGIKAQRESMEKADAAAQEFGRSIVQLSSQWADLASSLTERDPFGASMEKMRRGGQEEKQKTEDALAKAKQDYPGFFANILSHDQAGTLNPLSGFDPMIETMERQRRAQRMSEASAKAAEKKEREVELQDRRAAYLMEEKFSSLKAAAPTPVRKEAEVVAQLELAELRRLATNRQRKAEAQQAVDNIQEELKLAQFALDVEKKKVDQQEAAAHVLPVDRSTLDSETEAIQRLNEKLQLAQESRDRLSQDAAINELHAMAGKHAALLSAQREYADASRGIENDLTSSRIEAARVGYDRELSLLQKKNADEKAIRDIHRATLPAEEQRQQAVDDAKKDEADRNRQKARSAEFIFSEHERLSPLLQLNEYRLKLKEAVDQNVTTIDDARLLLRRKVMELWGSVLHPTDARVFDSRSRINIAAMNPMMAQVMSGQMKIPAYAAGVDQHPGGLAWVGEKGPELVDLPIGTRVIPNHKIPCYADGTGDGMWIGDVIARDAFRKANGGKDWSKAGDWKSEEEKRQLHKQAEAEAGHRISSGEGTHWEGPGYHPPATKYDKTWQMPPGFPSDKTQKDWGRLSIEPNQESPAPAVEKVTPAPLPPAQPTQARAAAAVPSRGLINGIPVTPAPATSAVPAGGLINGIPTARAMENIRARAILEAAAPAEPAMPTDPGYRAGSLSNRSPGTGYGLPVGLEAPTKDYGADNASMAEYEMRMRQLRRDEMWKQIGTVPGNAEAQRSAVQGYDLGDTPGRYQQEKAKAAEPFAMPDNTLRDYPSTTLKDGVWNIGPRKKDDAARNKFFGRPAEPSTPAPAAAMSHPPKAKASHQEPSGRGPGYYQPHSMLARSRASHAASQPREFTGKNDTDAAGHTAAYYQPHSQMGQIAARRHGAAGTQRSEYIGMQHAGNPLIDPLTGRGLDMGAGRAGSSQAGIAGTLEVSRMIAANTAKMTAQLQQLIAREGMH